ncbi:uncharacterized protein BDR25DRAFT_312988 [Lindgomyces ingoldianus]|uniref:Uncharacterized protein n=1 Tax=Lindgomyces ingoldianus TaxID=673940 RepID=A0ACB6QZH8_9PLEO|nr:uncharacterized protein BDR25DRAFT_312988 [Lindgomyces ingoldianus]KAF2472459.1 hypothetical protein BDR25DRAFT_312988 [Lindgomyces ingoldianus]
MTITAQPLGVKDEDAVLQQWQDEENSVRISQGSIGCKTLGAKKKTIQGEIVDSYPLAEVQYRKFQAERTPEGINPRRVTLTICNNMLLETGLSRTSGATVSQNFEDFMKGLDLDLLFINEMQYKDLLLSATFFHEVNF